MSKHEGCVSTRAEKDWKYFFGLGSQVFTSWGHKSQVGTHNVRNRLIVERSNLNEQVVKAGVRIGKVTKLGATGKD